MDDILHVTFKIVVDHSLSYSGLQDIADLVHLHHHTIKNQTNLWLLWVLYTLELPPTQDAIVTTIGLFHFLGSGIPH